MNQSVDLVFQIQKFFSMNFRALNVVFVSCLIAFFGGFSNWTFLDSPDSEFYLSLSIFGDEANSIAPYPAYYWTRTTLIAPLNFLINTFGTEVGFLLFRILLTIICSLAILNIVNRIGLSKFFYPIATTAVLMNPAIVIARGNPYITYTGVALVTLTVSLLIEIFTNDDLTVSRSLHKFRSLSLGLTLASILFLNVFIFLMVLITTLLLFLSVPILQNRFRLYVLAIFFWILGFLSGVLAFLKLSENIFPEMNWFSTTKYYLEALNPANFPPVDHGLEFFSNTSLVIPLVSTLIALHLVIQNRKIESGVRVLGCIHIIFFSYFLSLAVFTGNLQLRLLIHNSYLIPTSLILIFFYCFDNFRHISLSLRLAFSVSIIFTVIPFYLLAFIPLATPTIWNGIVALIIVLLLFINIHLQGIKKLYNNGRNSIILFLSLSLSAILILQGSFNGQFFGQANLKSSFSPNVNQNLHIRDLIEVQNWVISNVNTRKSMVITDNGSNLVSFAAMQLWGPNTVPIGDGIDTKLVLQNSNVESLVTYSNNQNYSNQILRVIEDLQLSGQVTNFKKFNTFDNVDIFVSIIDLSW